MFLWTCHDICIQGSKYLENSNRHFREKTKGKKLDEISLAILYFVWQFKIILHLSFSGIWLAFWLELCSGIIHGLYMLAARGTFSYIQFNPVELHHFTVLAMRISNNKFFVITSFFGYWQSVFQAQELHSRFCIRHVFLYISTSIIYI